MKRVKTVILDDSLLIREALAAVLQQDPNIQVVAKASNAFEARDLIVAHRPDVLITDIVMERMNGIEFVRQLLPQYPISVIMMSAYPEMRSEVEKLGAPIPFLLKSAQPGVHGMDLFYQSVLMTLKNLINQAPGSFDIKALTTRLIVMGASTGGAETLESILTALPCCLPPIVIAQHMPARFTKSFAQRLNASCALSVMEAENRQRLYPGCVYVAPGGFHTDIEKRENYFIRCAENVADDVLCPRIDILFASAAKYAGKQAVGVLLTGMGKDGATGLKQMHDSGAATIAQDKESSVIYGMPKAAFELGAVDYQLPSNKIAQKLCSLIQHK